LEKSHNGDIFYEIDRLGVSLMIVTASALTISYESNRLYTIDNINRGERV
jgi:hypothetical protein